MAEVLARTGRGPSWGELRRHTGWPSEILRDASWLAYDDEPGSLRPGPAAGTTAVAEADPSDPVADGADRPLVSGITGPLHISRHRNAIAGRTAKVTHQSTPTLQSVSQMTREPAAAAAVGRELTLPPACFTEALDLQTERHIRLPGHGRPVRLPPCRPAP